MDHCKPSIDVCYNDFNVAMYVYTEICEDKDPQCGANPGWWPSWCWDKSVFGGMMYDEVNEKCPKMCGHCGQSLVSVLPTCIIGLFPICTH